MTRQNGTDSYPDTHYRELVTISKIKMHHRNCVTECSRTLLKMVEAPRLNIRFHCSMKECAACQTDQASGRLYLCAEWEGLTPSGPSPSPLITPSLHSSLLPPLWAPWRLCGSCFTAIFWTSLQIKFYLPSCHKVI